MEELKNKLEQIKKDWERLKEKFNIEEEKKKFEVLENERREKGYWNPKKDSEKMKKWAIMNKCAAGEINSICIISNKFCPPSVKYTREDRCRLALL